MGMAASQARYIELTARKSNVEYEGQQINQQRTALSNESSGMFTQLMTLQVPTPPSTDSYTTTQYTFNDGANDCTIANGDITPLSGDAQYNSNVKYTYTTTPYTGVDKTRTDLTASNVSGTYRLGSTNLTAYNSSSATDLAAVTQIATNCPNSAVAKATASGSTDHIFQYASGGTTYYVAQSQLDTMIAAGGAGTVDTCYAADIAKTNTETEKAYVEKNSTGRYTSIQLASESATIPLTASTTTNQTAYNDAMNQYTYNQALYEKQVQDINAKTEVIQEEDRTLEMKLSQLDTEQKALSTEMESVKKVIDKNVESTFKTFQ